MNTYRILDAASDAPAAAFIHAKAGVTIRTLPHDKVSGRRKLNAVSVQTLAQLESTEIQRAEIKNDVKLS